MNINGVNIPWLNINNSCSHRIINHDRIDNIKSMSKIHLYYYEITFYMFIYFDVNFGVNFKHLQYKFFVELDNVYNE